MTAYYNENDKNAAAWLRNLIAAGLIANGDVDDRSIEDVKPSDLIGYKQCHFFAGIGVWSYALRRAGWADERPIWTGSCPCQPFSAAGKGEGFADERHLWSAWEWLQRRAKPRSVPILGEQVASKAGLAWIDVVQADLERQNYTVRTADLCAAGVGAPHIRQRLFFVADNTRNGRREERANTGGQPSGDRAQRIAAGSQPSSSVSELANTDEGRSGRNAGTISGAQGSPERSLRSLIDGAESGSTTDFVGHTDDEGSQGRCLSRTVGERQSGSERVTWAPGPVNGFWHDAEWLPCSDGKSRPVEPGTFPLAHGAPARVGRLRAYGNAIVATLAEEFIRAYIEVTALESLQ